MRLTDLNDPAIEVSALKDDYYNIIMLCSINSALHFHELPESLL